MSAVDDYNRMIADTGAGYDAAGRLNFTGPYHMYMGPGESLKAAKHLKDAEMRAFQEQPAEMRIRQLLDQLEQQRMAMGVGPGTLRLATQPLATGNSSYSYNYQPRVN